jgi:glycosyltransferase involved in cell wall biosynthesis
MTSIIIPAHNEENVIEACLQAFVGMAEHGEFEVIVVCNGCSDKTADIVRGLSRSFTCIETDKASKTNALNIGDEIARSFPRFYIDADVVLQRETVLAVSRILENGYLAAAPEVKMNLKGSTVFVKAFYDILFSLPYVRAGMIGAGVYALSRKGRDRFTRFPEIIADDGFVRCLFNESERGLARGYYSIVNAPKNLAALIKIKTRSRLGRYELEKKYPEIITNEEKDYRGAIRDLIFEVKLWPKILVYLLVNIITRIRATKQMKYGFTHWERDDSSR